jgi:hypothetical protein
MKKYRLYITQKSKPAKPIRDILHRCARHSPAFLLMFLTVIFASEKLLPIFQNRAEISQEIHAQKRLIEQEEAKLGQIRLSAPFNRQWLPKQYLQFGSLCTNDTLIYHRLLLLQKKSQVYMNKIQIKNEEVGFSFTIETIGSYPDLLDWLQDLENKFSFLRIKNMNLLPHSAENIYKGLLLLHIEGNLW